MIPAMRSGWRKPVCSAIAPPCENPASTSRSAFVPRFFSRAIKASIKTCEARTPRSSSRRIAPSVMSYQARMRMPPLIVTGWTGACGKTKRIAALGSRSSGTIGAKSLPSAPNPCSQMTLAAGFFPVSISIASRSSGIVIGSTRFRPDRRLGPEGPHHFLVRLDVGPADQIDAVGYGGENARDYLLAVLVFQAFERFADRFGLAGQVDDEGVLAHDRDLPRENRGGNELEADPAHLLTEPRHRFVGYRERGLRRDVPRSRAGAAGSQHQVAAAAVDQVEERRFDHRSLVRDKPRLHSPGARHDASEPFLERRNALVLVDAARGAVADRNESDQQLFIPRHRREPVPNPG